MSRPGIPSVITVTSSETSSNIGGSAIDIVLRARSSNVQAISLNVTTSSEAPPTATGGNAMVLFPGESIQLPVNLLAPATLQVKRIIFNDTGIGDPVLEIVEIIP